MTTLPRPIGAPIACKPAPVWAPPRRGIRLVEAVVLAAVAGYFALGVVGVFFGSAA